MKRHTLVILTIAAVLSACVTVQRSPAPPPVEVKRVPGDPVIDLDTQTVIAAVVLQMMRRDTSNAPVGWAPRGDFKAAFEKFAYDGFEVAGVEVFNQQQDPGGRVTVGALVRLKHPTGVRAANVINATYQIGPLAKPAPAPAQKGKSGKQPAGKLAGPVIYTSSAAPLPSRDPELEVLVVPSAAVASEPLFKTPNYPAWLAAARRLAIPAPSQKTKVHIFAFAKERVLAKPDLKITTGGKQSGKAVCVDDQGFAACVVEGDLQGMSSSAVFYLNGKFASEARVK
ncbi:MAG TPA: hypothetical protein VN419_04680 [Humidesulfovibrio sp.]|uniref:hypothetical protein n=1 Tax=Humidesulfovibrio sp. TaxID=2910988 RepID=UPI002C8A0171|nr:hypothetical protein [Humidesulfovibrio sp.]HWR03295.1 hypothetical protein [Humidesulfovibrio sp.]